MGYNTGMHANLTGWGLTELTKTLTALTLAPLSLAYAPPLPVVTDVEKCHQSQNSVISSLAEGRPCICCGTRTRCHLETCPCTTAVKSSDRQPTNTVVEGESHNQIGLLLYDFNKYLFNNMLFIICVNLYKFHILI